MTAARPGWICAACAGIRPSAVMPAANVRSERVSRDLERILGLSSVLLRRTDSLVGQLFCLSPFTNRGTAEPLLTGSAVQPNGDVETKRPTSDNYTATCSSGNQRMN